MAIKITISTVRCEWQLCLICNWLWSSCQTWNRSKPYETLTSRNKICNLLLTNIQKKLPLGIYILRKDWDAVWVIMHNRIKLILLIYCGSNDILAPYNLIKFISYCKLNNIQCKLIFYPCKSRNKWCLDDWVIIKGKILHDWMHANPTNCLLMYSGIQLSKRCPFLQLCV